MQFTKDMKAGYQGKKDAMREKASKLTNHPGHAEAVYFSKSAADREHMRPYKDGGHVKQRKEVQREIESFKDDMERHRQAMHHKKMEAMEKKNMKKEHKQNTKCSSKIQKFAMGGVAKIRHDEATKDGKPKNPKKSSVKDIL